MMRLAGLPNARRLTTNIFADLPASLPDELVSALAENSIVRIEQIVSTGHASPEGVWYNQDEHEWVVLLKGKAI